MKNFINALGAILIVFTLLSCSTNHNSNNNYYKTLSAKSNKYNFIKNYFILSENREIEIWYSTYLKNCKQFYKIQNPDRDTIFNLIKSYWLNSNNQHHDITKIELKKTNFFYDYLVTMNYSYFIISSNSKKIIPNLKLQLLMDKEKNIISIKEISRN